MSSTSVPSHPQLIAHRAGTTDAPENTRPAVEMSLRNGADAVWLTLQLSKDNIPVLYRPSDLKVLTARSGLVSQFSAAELGNSDTYASRDYDAKHHINRPQNERFGIPQLAQILKDFPHTFFYLDIKSPDANPQIFAHALYDVLQKIKLFIVAEFIQPMITIWMLCQKTSNVLKAGIKLEPFWLI